MSDPASLRPLPRGLISASFVASVLAGPLWNLLNACFVDAAAAAARQWPATQQISGIEPTADSFGGGVIDLIFVPLVTAPLSILSALLTAFPVTALLVILLFALFPDQRWPALRRTWIAVGCVLGAIVGPLVLTMWYGPSIDGRDGWAAAVIGAIDGLCCAVIAHRHAAKSGAFARGAGTPQ